jgi:hypothetical protein
MFAGFSVELFGNSTPSAHVVHQVGASTAETWVCVFTVLAGWRWCWD